MDVAYLRMLGLALVLVILSVGRAADEVPYGVGSWPVEYGNHRARVQVTAKADAVFVHLPLRQREMSQATNAVIVVEAATGSRVPLVERARLAGGEYLDFVFQPFEPGEYYVYYMSYTTDPAPWAYSDRYVTHTKPADKAWMHRNGLTYDDLHPEIWNSLPHARVLELQARTEFDRFDPMEIRDGDGMMDLLSRNPERTYLVFHEDRRFPIRMTDAIPLRWTKGGQGDEFHGKAYRGEFYAFQLGVYAKERPLEDVEIEFDDLCSETHTVPASAFRCFNLGGTDWLGRPLKKALTIPAGTVQALWIGVQVPRNAKPGEYSAAITLRPQKAEETRVRVHLTVLGQVLEYAGDNELWRLSRLRWLDSTIGLDEEVVAPYAPMEVSGPQVTCLSREIQLREDTGLPRSIESGQRQILRAPIEFIVEEEGRRVKWTGGRPEIVEKHPGAVTWRSTSSSANYSLECTAKMEFDGYVNYRLILRTVNGGYPDVRLEIPIRREVATYMMGLGREGGYRPKEWKWAWDIERCNNAVWIGDVDAGLQVKLKANVDTWDIYNLKASGIPESWGNGGKGGCTVTEEDGRVVIRAFTGGRRMAQNESIEFRFGLLITPVKPLDPAHWNQRYYHDYVPPEKAVASGANIINIHHGNELNPYINYPFLTTDKLAAYVKDAHEKGVKVKLYYTVRELSNHVAELWPLRSLGYEVFTDGPGGGHSWLQEHLIDHYAPAWHQPLPDGSVDAALTTTGLSRWHNYYLEGLAWLLRNVQIDGLYLDGIGYDREVMKRVRKVMDRTRPGCLIDFHSGNEFPFHDLRVSPANKYMEHFPYINSLWLGEGYEYEVKPPDYWLVEISGIPFGLYGEMLHGNGNPWRGMVYGMTARYYSGADPKQVWKLWDDFGIQDARMIGYWSPKCPVRTDNKNVLATAYVKKGKTLISIASWAKETTRVRLRIDWKALGLDPKKARLTAPAIPGFQDATSFSPNDAIPVEPGKGWLLMLE